MIGILAESFDDALRSLGRAVESTSGERQESGDLLALADRVGRTLTGRGVAHNALQDLMRRVAVGEDVMCGFPIPVLVRRAKPRDPQRGSITKRAADVGQ